MFLILVTVLWIICSVATYHYTRFLTKRYELHNFSVLYKHPIKTPSEVWDDEWKAESYKYINAIFSIAFLINLVSVYFTYGRIDK